MILTEIFDTKITNIKTNQQINNHKKPDDPRQRPFSRVTDDPDPHMVNKISQHDDYAYNIFVDYIVQNKLAQENPHFPRIYDIKVAHGKNDKGIDVKKYKWQIEKFKVTLHDWLKVDSQPDSPKFTKEFSEELRPKLLLISEHYFTERKNKTFEFVFSNEEIRRSDVYEKFYTCFRSSENFKDGLFKDAFEIVEKLYAQSNAPGQRGLMYDLHPNNFMLRFGRYIPQIVILDPFASW